jgi:hypothetical protein
VFDGVEFKIIDVSGTNPSYFPYLSLGVMVGLSLDDLHNTPVHCAA